MHQSHLPQCTIFVAEMCTRAHKMVHGGYLSNALRDLWNGSLCVYWLYPPLQRSWKGGILVSPCPSVRLSVCGQNRVRSVSSTILIGSISYLHILSSNFRRCVACNARFKIQKFEILAIFWNLQLWLCHLLTWDPIWLNGMGNHEAAGGILRTQAF